MTKKYLRTPHNQLLSVQSLSRVRLFATPWTATCQASLSIINSRSLLKLMPIEWVMPSNDLILCHPRLLLPLIFPSIRVFYNESVHPIRWSKFRASASNEYLGLISFRVDWLDLLAVQGILLAFVFLSKNKFKVTELLFITRKFLHLSQCFPKKQTNRGYIYIHNSLCK